MKLFTEEQVRKMLSLTDGVVDWDLYTHDEIIKSQEPIELPSDLIEKVIQKQLIKDVMQADEKDGLYDENK